MKNQTTWSASALAKQLRMPYGAELFSPLGDAPCLMLALSDGDTAATEADVALCLHWLPQLACPVIGIGSGGPLAEQVDCLAPTEAAAAPLLRNIHQYPLAAMTLVQVLRHNERATIEHGLLAESLAYGTLQSGAEFQRYLSTRPEPVSTKTDGQTVLVDRADNCLSITLNRPGRTRNAFCAAMRDELVAALQLLDQDETISRAVIRGAGACFSSGGDLSEFGRLPDTATAHAIRSTRNAAQLIAANSDRISCRVHSACIGAGIELPAFAAHIHARANAFFQLPEITLGLIPGAGGTVSILRRIGRQRTAWLALSGRRINAERALQWGLIDAIGTERDEAGEPVVN